MAFLSLFLALWLLTLLAGEHLLANRGIVLGEDLPHAAVWLIRVCYFVGTGGAAFVFLRLTVDALTVP